MVNDEKKINNEILKDFLGYQNLSSSAKDLFKANEAKRRKW